MSDYDFTVVINLSNFFNDHRHRARLFVNDELKTIKDFENKIADVFGLQNFLLTCQNEFLPPTEDVRILRSNEVIWVVPSIISNCSYENVLVADSLNKLNTKRNSTLSMNGADEKKQRKCSTVTSKTSEEQEEDTINRKTKKKKKRSYEEIPNSEGYIKKSSKKKKYKDFEENLLPHQNKIDNHITKLKKKSEHTFFSEHSNYSEESSSTGMHEDCMLQKAAKSGVTSKIFEEREEDTNKRKTREKNKHGDEEIPNSEEYIPKASRKKDFEENNLPHLNKINKHTTNLKKKTENTFFSEHNNYSDKSNYTPKISNQCLTKKVEENSKKTILQSSKSNYLDKSSNEYQVAVGNSISENVSCKKSVPIPTITDQYLKEKKINIVKIDYITNPIRVTENVNKDLELSPLPVNTEVEEEENQVEEIVKNTEVDIDQKENNIKPYPTKNFSFINKSSRGLKNSIIFKYKNELIKPKDAIIGPTQSTFENASIHSDKCKEIDVLNPLENEDLNENHVLELTENNLTSTEALTKSEIVKDPMDNCSTEALTKSEIVKDPMDNCSIINLDSIESSIQDISKISPCINMLDTHDFDNSEIMPTNYGQKSIKKLTSGIGLLLDTIRNSESSEISMNSTNDDPSEFVTKRKRHRVRKRRSKSKNVNEETFIPPIYKTPKPLLVAACPKQHLKFSDEGEKLENNKEDCIEESEISEFQIDEENVLKAPLMTDMIPKIGDIVAFKVLKISDNFTPELSSCIIGHIKFFSIESKMVTLEIKFGLDQFDSPQGKLSIENNEDKNNTSSTKDCLWSDLIEPRLIYP